MSTYPTPPLKLIKWCNDFFKKHLIYPSIQQIKKKISSEKWLNETELWNKTEIRSFRNSLEAISKYNKIGNTGKIINKYHASYRISGLGWVEIDLGFFTKHNIKYGKFMLAVDILSKRVYVESIKNKTFNSIKTFLLNLKKQPGFTYLRRILSDKESALKSNKNKEELEKLLKIKIFLTDRKASMAERFIRSYKLYTSKALLAKKLNYTKWRYVIEDVLLKLNTKKLYNSSFRPIDINTKNYISYIQYLMENKPYFAFNFYRIGLPSKKYILNKIFKYNINDLVYLAKKIYPNIKVRNQYFGETRSVAGHFDKSLPHFKIINRKLVLSSQLNISPIYDIKPIEGNGKILYNIYEFYLRHYPIKEIK